VKRKTLAQWLAFQEGLNPAGVDLGLDRVQAVRRAMGLGDPPFTVVTVAGTNGKGSSVAMLEAILRAAGYRTATYTSPHLLRYNERVRLGGAEVDDEALIEAFEAVEAARGGIPLTYFEFGTLAVLHLFYRHPPDVAVLEVGLGGRLDAVNVLDPDVALITAVDVDHAAWLGEDREDIGREKAGILRAARPAVCSDPRPPASVVDHAASLGAPLYRLGVAFDYRSTASGWTFRGPSRVRHALPLPALRGAFQLANAAGVLMVLELLDGRWPVDQQAVRRGLTEVALPGRFQVLPGPVPVVLDVAHNPQAAGSLAATLAAWPVPGRTRAVVGMLADKDVAGVLAALAGRVDAWYLAAPDAARAAPVEVLDQALGRAVPGAPRRPFGSVAEALAAARGECGEGDRVLVFGSFHTVAEALATEAAVSR
jgi:dihydrofolate synthase/folylpolyglutamate synthase